MRRRGVGVGAVKDIKQSKQKYLDKGTSLQENLVEEMTKQLDQFRSKLEVFAFKHQKSIKADPEFREHFQEMCATIGVDPLASSKGFWSELLGMGSFYYEIAVQAVEIVLSTSHLNGGFMTLGELSQRLNRSRPKALNQTEVSCDDVLRAMNSLNILGKSCGVIPSGKNKGDYLVFCVPEELSLDNTTIVQHVALSGSPCVTAQGWTAQRIDSVIQRLICEGIIWIDIDKGSTLYWFPSLFPFNSKDANGND